jgi:hypothetical protein
LKLIAASILIAGLLVSAGLFAVAFGGRYQIASAGAPQQTHHLDRRIGTVAWCALSDRDRGEGRIQCFVEGQWQ